MITETAPIEISITPWLHLARRTDTWRMQLYLKGRKLTALQLVNSVQANHKSQEQGAIDFELPIEAVREAFEYVDQETELLEKEAEIERMMIKRTDWIKRRISGNVLKSVS